MTEKYYTCTLLSDVVVNASLATEGNMSSLDYIPGSTIMGIVANSLYKEKTNPNRLLPLLHEGGVRFGDACVSIYGKVGLPIPFQYFTNKEKKDMEKDPVFLGYHLNDGELVDEEGKLIQPQQVRSGYLALNGESIDYISSIPKKFSLKSAHDRETRTANDSQMFGMEALPRGMELIFSIQFGDPDDIALIEGHLIGRKYIGKSKSAEYGMVYIQHSKEKPSPVPTFDFEQGVLVYAASNLCLYDQKKGMPTYQPDAKSLGLQGGEICWEKSQVRTFDYATWNTKRKTTNPVRYCIARGSVFFVKGVQTDKVSAYVGEYNSEGLGKVIYNPEFLRGIPSSKKSAYAGKFKKQIWDQLQNRTKPEKNNGKETPLIAWLKERKAKKSLELKLSEEVHKTIYERNDDLLKIFNKVTSSQWGQIRQMAVSAPTIEKLAVDLFNNPQKKDNETNGQHKARKGFLMHGVAHDRFWSQNKNKPINILKGIFKIEMDDNHEVNSRVIRCGKSKEYIALFAAEMAHRYIRLKNKKNHENV